MLHVDGVYVSNARAQNTDNADNANNTDNCC